MFTDVVTHRGTRCWWEDLLEKRATKEKQSVKTCMGQNVSYSKMSTFVPFLRCVLCLLWISLLFHSRVTGDPKVCREKREQRVKRGLQGSR